MHGPVVLAVDQTMGHNASYQSALTWSVTILAICDDTYIRRLRTWYMFFEKHIGIPGSTWYKVQVLFKSYGLRVPVVGMSLHCRALKVLLTGVGCRVSGV
jgi:hypothetical protein